MVTYVYVVKCPECEDEFFDFFAEAKDYAMGCFTKKPIITQTEVNRNDFGECTNHCDLGQVWSWEDMMKDTEPKDTVFSKNETFGISEGIDDFDDFDIGPQSDEFAPVNFDDFTYVEDEDEAVKKLTEAKANPFHDAIFEALDYLTEFSDIFPVPENIMADTWAEMKDDINYGISSDFEIAEIVMEYMNKDLEIGRKHPEIFEDDPQSELTLETYNRLKRAYDRAVAEYEAANPDEFEESCEKSLPEDVTIESLVETLEENEDEVECKTCFNLFPKADCTKGDHGYTCSTCSAPSDDPFDQDFPEVADYVVSDTEVGSAVANLVVDEFEAIGGYEAVDELVQHARIPEDKKEKIIDTLDHIRKEEEEHVDELKELSTTAEPEVAEPAVVEEPVLLPEEEVTEQPIDEDLEWHTYKITFSTPANPDSEHTTTFTTWQSDVEYAWRMSNANIPHTTIKSIELVEDINQEPDSVHDLGNEYDGGYPEEKPLLPETDEDEI